MKRQIFILFFSLFSTVLLAQNSTFTLSNKRPALGDGYIYYSGPHTASMTDLNGDGYPDLVIGGVPYIVYQYFYQNAIMYLYDPQKNNFEYVDTVRDDSGKIIMGEYVGAADIDFDGKAEIIYNYPGTYSWDPGTSIRFEQQGVNRFAYMDTLRDTVKKPYYFPQGADFYDYNHDSLMDVYYPAGNYIYYAENRGDTAFAFKYELQDTSGESVLFPSEVSKTDFYTYVKNSDTLSTNILVSLGNHYVLNYEMTDSNKVIFDDTLCLYDDKPITLDDYGLMLAYAHDGRNYYLKFGYNKAVQRYMKTDTGIIEYDYPIASNSLVRTSHYTLIYFYDLDHDGKKDLFMSDVDGTLLYSRNISTKGNIYFALPDTLRTDDTLFRTGMYFYFAIDDLNNDGKADLFVANYNGILSRYEQVSGTNFKYIGDITNLGEPASIAISDFNHDGKKEITSLTQRTCDFTAFDYNMDNNTITDTVLHYWFVYGSPMIAVGDINGDGYDDMLVGYYDNVYQYLDVYINDKNDSLVNQNGTTPEWYFGRFGTYYSLALCDADGDGQQELFGSKTSGTVDYFNYTFSSESALVNNYVEQTFFSPNPARDQISFDSQLRYIEIYNLSGQKVLIKQNPENALNISPLTKGVYIIRSQAMDGKMYYSKLIKL